MSLGKVLAVVSALALALSGAPLKAQAPGPQNPVTRTPAAPDRNAIAWDPAIRLGVLPNGLRYAVMRNATPPGGVSIRLGVNVGSFEESDAERGAAHFVEHMAFAQEGPAVEPWASFASAGIAFGHDRNAQTGLYATLYQIDLPKADDRVLGLAFHWLGAVASGAAFTEAGAARQRAIIAAERETQVTADTLARRASQAFLTPGLRFLDRDPIGSRASLAAMTAGRLSAFYRRWYRPGNAVVTAVGDEPAEALERRVADAFGGWTPGPAPARVVPAPLDASPGPDALGVAAPSAVTTVAACRLHPPPPRGADDVARLRQTALTGLWTRVLNGRLTADTRDPAAALLAGQAITEWDSREIAGACVGATPSQDRWAPALTRLRGEIERMATTDPTEDELEAALNESRSYYRGPADQAATRPSQALASDLANSLLKGDTVPSPAEAFRAFDAAVADVTPADVKAAFNRDWSGSGPRIVVITQKPVARAAILAAWNAAPAMPPPATAASPAGAWAYANFGSPGKVARREVFTGPDRVRLTFANGVVVNIMHTDFEQNQVKVAMAFGAGRREIPDTDVSAAQIGAVVFKQTGLGRHDFAAIQGLFADRGWGADLSIGSDRFVLSGGGPRSGLGQQLQLLAAFASDPGFRDIDPVIATVVSAVYRRFDSVPNLVLAQAISEAAAPGGPGSLPPQARLARLTTRDLERLFKPALTQAPLRVSIVGDVDEKEATALAAETFGALPPRAATPREQAVTTFLRFPNGPMTPVEVTHSGPAGRAMVGTVWPLYVASPARRREEYALGLAADLLRDSLLRRLREDLGKTYDPIAFTAMPDNADQGYLEAVVETAPADVAIARREIEQAAARLARGEFTQADLDQVRAPASSEWARAEHTNALWLDALAASDPPAGAAEELASRRSVVASITLREVRQATAAWLARAPLVVVVKPRYAPPRSEGAP